MRSRTPGYLTSIDRRAVVAPVADRLRVTEHLVRARLGLPLTPALAVACLVLAAAVLAGVYSTRTTTWAVMTDELQVVRLAVSIGESLSPVPRIHGAYYGAHSQLYPLLLSPFYAMLSAPAAANAAYALNAVLLASSAVPAYLLGRSVTGSRGAGYVAAALTAFTPWLALSATLLTENAAYPAFAWAVLLCQRALADASPRRDALAVAGLTLAFAARTQLLVLALALPIVLVLHELGYALRTEPSARAAFRRARFAILYDHRVLVATYGAGLLVAVALSVVGSLGGVVGNYSVPFRGDLVPPGFWSSAAAHVDQIAVGTGLLPFALAGSWALLTTVRPARKEAHAFAALLLVVVPALTFQATSFDLRFTPEQFVQERYLIYIVPLVAVGAGAWLAQRSDLGFRLVTLAATTFALVGLLSLAAYDDEVFIFWTSPAAAFYPALAASAGAAGLSVTAFLQISAIASALLVAVAAWRVPRVAITGAAIAASAFGAFEARYVFEHYVEPSSTTVQAGPARDWIDRSVPGGTSVALVPGGPDGPAPWWEAELWNKEVDRVLRVGSGPTFSPFPVDRVSVDIVRGLLVGAPPSEYLVVSRRERRFDLDARRIAAADGLVLVRSAGAYRLAWATRGLSSDGWTHPGRVALLRLYGQRETERRTVILTLAASRFSPAPVDVELRGGGQLLADRVHPGEARPPVQLTFCVPAGGISDVELRTDGRTRLPDGRVVAVHVEGLAVHSAGRCDEFHRIE